MTNTEALTAIREVVYAPNYDEEGGVSIYDAYWMYWMIEQIVKRLDGVV